MKIALLLVILLLGNCVTQLTSKGCSNILAEQGIVGNTLLIFVNGLLSCVFFFILTEFSIEINSVSLWLAAFYAFVCVGAVIIGIVVYRYAEIANVNVIKCSVSLVATFIAGVLIFKESVNFTSILRIFIMIISAVLIFIDCKYKQTVKQNSKRSNLFMVAVLVTCLVALVTYTNIQSKFIAVYNIIPDVNSFFFMTNVYMMAMSSIVMFIIALFNKEKAKNCIQLFEFKKMGYMIGNVFSSNVTSLLGVLILKNMDVSIFTPISSAFTILSGTLASFLIKERLSIFSVISVILAILVVII